jgi:hypothetical protein
MAYNKNTLAIVVTLVGFISGCNQSSSTPDATSGNAPSSSKGGEIHWSPKWDTSPDKGRQEKSILNPIASFADPGFRGSPVPQNEEGKKKEMKNREDFLRSFRSERECFGITLRATNPKDSDFSLQVFNGIDGRTGRLQWVLYRMDTLGLKANGETTGAGTPMGIDSVAKSVCSVIHDAVSEQGGRVEGE